jgi:chromosome segregation ATPase
MSDTQENKIDQLYREADSFAERLYELQKEHAVLKNENLQLKKTLEASEGQNKRLKTELDDLGSIKCAKPTVAHLLDCVYELHQENEQLKATVHELAQKLMKYLDELYATNEANFQLKKSLKAFKAKI